MPEFIPEHTPSDLDEFTTGYLEAAEWLLDEDIDRSKVRGFPKAAIARAKAECGAFLKANAEDLALYEQISGRTRTMAGHDFWLSRNGHGAGFFDRGDEPVFDRLQDAARDCGESGVFVLKGWLHLT